MHSTRRDAAYKAKPGRQAARGLQIYFHDTGKVSSESSYILGKRNGLFVKYYRTIVYTYVN